MRYEKTCEIGSGVPVIQRLAVAHLEKCAYLLEEVIPWARRARRCAAAVKGEVMVEVSDGQGQVARACEDRVFLRPKPV